MKSKFVALAALSTAVLLAAVAFKLGLAALGGPIPQEFVALFMAMGLCAPFLTAFVLSLREPADSLAARHRA